MTARQRRAYFVRVPSDRRRGGSNGGTTGLVARIADGLSVNRPSLMRKVKNRTLDRSMNPGSRQDACLDTPRNARAPELPEVGRFPFSGPSPAASAQVTPWTHLLASPGCRRRESSGARTVPDDLFLIWLEPSIEFRFEPGQYITIGAGGIERPFSIASAPYEPHIELFVEYVFPEHGGHLTPLLYAHHVGEMLTMRPKAKGRFTRRAGVTNHVMVATVTGIAPYVSMIRQFIHDRETRSDAPEQTRFFVMQGASHRDELVYDTELMTLVLRHPDLVQFVSSVSRPSAERNAGWTGRTGRINLLIEEYLDQWDLPKPDTLIYLCGNPEMIEDASARVTPNGWRVVTERFWRLRPGD